VNLVDLNEAVSLKTEFRGRTIIEAKEIFLRKEARLKKLWTVRLSSQMVALPEFDEVFRAALRELRQGGLLNPP
jgi:hypothetical protein